MRRAENVPERAPEMNEVVRGERSGWVEANRVLRISNPAQYRPENGTSRQRVGPRPLHRIASPFVLTSLLISAVVEAYVGDMRSATGQLLQFL